VSAVGRASDGWRRNDPERMTTLNDLGIRTYQRIGIYTYINAILPCTCTIHRFPTAQHWVQPGEEWTSILHHLLHRITSHRIIRPSRLTLCTSITQTLEPFASASSRYLPYLRCILFTSIPLTDTSQPIYFLISKLKLYTVSGLDIFPFTSPCEFWVAYLGAWAIWMGISVQPHAMKGFQARREAQ
jgi:hypothetical protein